MMYDIVRNVVSPANTSVRTDVLWSLSLNSFSNIVPPLAKPKSLVAARSRHDLAGIRF